VNSNYKSGTSHEETDLLYSMGGSYSRGDLDKKAMEMSDFYSSEKQSMENEIFYLEREIFDFN
jgi:hypothetical protein